MRIEVRLSDNTVTRDGTLVCLSEQTADLLFALNERDGESLSHDEIRVALWGSRAPFEWRRAIGECVRRLRNSIAVIGGVIEPVRANGYCLIWDAVDEIVDTRKRPPTMPWTDADLSLLLSGETEIAGRSRDAVRRKARKLGLPWPSKTQSKHTQEYIDRVLTPISMGHRWRYVQKHIGIKRNVLAGIVHRNRSRLDELRAMHTQSR